MTRLNVGPARLDLDGLTIARTCVVTLDVTAASMPAVATWRFRPLSGTPTISITGTISGTEITFDLDDVVNDTDLAALVATAGGPIQLTHELVADGSDWIEGTVPFAAQLDGRAGSGTRSVPLSVTVTGGTATLDVSVLGPWIGEIDGGPFGAPSPCLAVDGGAFS